MSEELKGKSEEELETTIAEAKKALEAKRREARAGTIAKIKELAASIGVTVTISESNVVPMKAGRGGKVPAKYRDPATGDVWSGRGVQPTWLRKKIEAGHSPEDFLLPEFKPQQAAA
ncbi:H-NS family nucleoid-associated regulatory protein [Methylomagnum ishizawai]|uniref:H-NS histone family protein n=1 Tax=Methylomagnum ishizawai TaxID=1760988 RepID=UPI001C334BAD|nr:H-NS histone family protein [Methylomagnum ishizawai]BBL75449.1 hypothetical protein MishRS11D_25470 [Methylomagnum ishizawai]